MDKCINTCVKFFAGFRVPKLIKIGSFLSEIFKKEQCIIFTSAEVGGYVFGSVCLSVCPSDYLQTCERILTKFFGGVGHGSRTK